MPAQPAWFHRLDRNPRGSADHGNDLYLVGLAGSDNATLGHYRLAGLVRVAIPDDRFVGGSSVLAAFSQRAASFLSRQPNMALTLYGLCVILWG